MMMMKMVLRVSAVALTATLAGTLAAPASFAASGGSTVTGIPNTVNDGDRGYGNCGFNKAGKPGTKGTPPEGGNEKGLGGFSKQDVENGLCTVQGGGSESTTPTTVSYFNETTTYN